MTNQTKQTAVEWLVEHFQKLQKEGEKMSWQQIIDICKLSKEMETEQIIETASAYYHENTKLTPSHFYEQTYGGNK